MSGSGELRPLKNPAPPMKGGMIDIVFNGRPRRIIGGVSLAQALSQAGTRVFARSLKYRRPRGPFCGQGQCAGCHVRLNGVPMVRSCLVEPRPGDRVVTEAGWPSTRYDLFAVMDWIFSGGMDTMRGFNRPFALRQTYLSLVRKFSGLGHLPDAAPAALPPPTAVAVDVLIIGGGTAGTAAAQQIRRQRPSTRLMVADRSRGEDNVVFLSPGDDGQFRSIVSSPRRSALLVSASKIIVATGTYDAGLPFRGSDLPGVFTGDGLVRLHSDPSVPLFQRLAIFGGNAHTLSLLDAWKERICLLASPWELAPEVRRRAQTLGIPVREGVAIASAEGRNRIRTVALVHRTTGQTESFRLDGLVLSHRDLPQVGLLFQAGAQMHWRNGAAAYFPEINERCETSVPGVFAIGGVAGFCTEADSRESGERAALAILEGDGTLGLPIRDPQSGPALLDRRVHREGPCPMLDYQTDFLRVQGSKKVILCPCEDVTLQELERVVSDGWETSLEVAKRLTGVGMGLCQGRYCMPDAVLLLAALSGRPPSDIGFFTQRPPVWPLRIGDLAGGK